MLLSRHGGNSGLEVQGLRQWAKEQQRTLTINLWLPHVHTKVNIQTTRVHHMEIKMKAQTVITPFSRNAEGVRCRQIAE